MIEGRLFTRQKRNGLVSIILDDGSIFMEAEQNDFLKKILLKSVCLINKSTVHHEEPKRPKYIYLGVRTNGCWS